MEKTNIIAWTVTRMLPEEQNLIGDSRVQYHAVRWVGDEVCGHLCSAGVIVVEG